MDDELKAVIEGYRLVIHSRYDYDRLQKHLELPNTFGKEKLEALRNYFLQSIYPPVDQREHLNDAFQHLERHIANPKYLLNILKDSFGIVLRYGVHLPKMLKTGLKALRSFQTVSNFEKTLATNVKRSGFEAPLSSDDIDKLIRQLPKQAVFEFIDDSLVLFETLHDRILIKRVISIIDHLILKMQSKPEVYPIEDAEALLLGRNLIVEGDSLFETLTSQEQKLLFEMIEQVERKEMQRIFDNAE